MPSDAFAFEAELWLHAGPAAWYFVAVPDEVADEIRAVHGGRQKAFGSLGVTVTIGATRWNTSLFWDRARETYLLPVKATVRRAEGVDDGDLISVLVEPA